MNFRLKDSHRSDRSANNLTDWEESTKDSRRRAMGIIAAKVTYTVRMCRFFNFGGLKLLPPLKSFKPFLSHSSSLRKYEYSQFVSALA